MPQAQLKVIRLATSGNGAAPAASAPTRRPPTERKLFEGLGQ